jgi:hypothetical protein
LRRTAAIPSLQTLSSLRDCSATAGVAPGMILSAFLLLFCAVFTWKVFPKKHEAEGPHGGSRGTEQAYDTLDQVKQCTLSSCSPLSIARFYSMESQNLILPASMDRGRSRRLFSGSGSSPPTSSSGSISPRATSGLVLFTYSYCLN